MDDRLRNVVKAVLTDGSPTSSRAGRARELWGVALDLEDPERD